MSTPNGNGASRLGLWLSIGVAVMLLLGMIGSVFYVAFEVQANSVAISSLRDSLSASEVNVTKLQLQVASLETSLNEIETQFCSNDLARNLMHATDLRIMAMIWKKTFGDVFPTDNAYYPTICNRRVKQ